MDSRFLGLVLALVSHTSCEYSTSQVFTTSFISELPFGAGFLSLITRPEPSVQDLRDIGNLDSQFKAWHNSVKIRMMQAESLQAEALSLGVDTLAGFTAEDFSEICPAVVLLLTGTLSRGQVAQDYWCVLQT